MIAGLHWPLCSFIFHMLFERQFPWANPITLVRCSLKLSLALHPARLQYSQPPFLCLSPLPGSSLPYLISGSHSFLYSPGLSSRAFFWFSRSFRLKHFCSGHWSGVGIAGEVKRTQALLEPKRGAFFFFYIIINLVLETEHRTSWRPNSFYTKLFKRGSKRCQKPSNLTQAVGATYPK